jgi:hypothetical protein
VLADVVEDEFAVVRDGEREANERRLHGAALRAQLRIAK